MVKAVLSDSEMSTNEIEAWVKKTKTIDSVCKIPGDASARKYFRISSRGDSFIVMKQESFSGQGMNLPFLVVQAHLKRFGVDVPEVYDADPERGFVLLEDLGDITLLNRLNFVSDRDTERHLYEKMIDLLVDLQVKASPVSGQMYPPTLEAFRLFFDFEKLMWEMHFTIEHFYEKYLSRNFRSKDKKIIEEGLGEICRELASQPMVLAHRDFHSRNIMLATGEKSEERLVLIDFQDARMGPAQYDLVSLLKDSYYQLDEQQVETLMDYYIARWEANSGEKVDKAEFRKIFDFMTIQRNFKAIGSFASFLNRRGNATYLKYIGNTFENIRRVLLRYPQFSDLREVLFYYYYF